MENNLKVIWCVEALELVSDYTFRDGEALESLAYAIAKMRKAEFVTCEHVRDAHKSLRESYQIISKNDKRE